MADLNGQTIANTYSSLLKFSDNGVIETDAVQVISDGRGTATSLSLSTLRASIVLGSTADDDFIVDGTTFVVTGDDNRVGIGTAAPTCPLDIQANDETGVFLRLRSQDNATLGTGTSIGIAFAADEVVQDGLDDRAIIRWVGTEDHDGDQFDGRLEFVVQDTKYGEADEIAMAISTGHATTNASGPAGNVGIGTTTPDCKLEVLGSFAANGPSSTFVTFADGDATPSVATGNIFKHHASAQAITMFDGGICGQIITVISTAAITYDVTGTNLKGGSTDLVTADGESTVWVFDGTYWYLIGYMDLSQNYNVDGV